MEVHHTTYTEVVKDQNWAKQHSEGIKPNQLFELNTETVNLYTTRVSVGQLSDHSEQI